MKGTIVSIVIAGVFIGGAFLFSDSAPPEDGGQSIAPTNLSIENGIQVIEITAKGEYSPSKTTAVAGIPTIIRFNTKNTFDCSSALVIPSLGIQQNLPPTGSIDIDVGTPKEGPLFGSCGMGMYGFEIDFKS